MWKVFVGTLIVVILVAAVTYRVLAGWVGESLVCAGGPVPSDLLLVENFDPHYLVFERAAELEEAGYAPRALVPVWASGEPSVANPVAEGVARLMARQARIGEWELFPIQEAEPISLNAAYQIRGWLARGHIRSVIVVTSGFRSRRSALVYHTVLRDLGTRVSCAPVFGQSTPAHWTHTWHGIQEVTEEFLKLQYYRFYVIPFVARSSAGPSGDSAGGAPYVARAEKTDPVASPAPGRMVEAGREAALSRGL